MKISFFIKALSIHGGGAERVLVDVVNGLARRGHDVIVVTFDPVGVAPYYPLDASVRLISLGVGKIANRSNTLEVLMRIVAMKRTTSEIRPDIAVGFMHSSYVLLGLALKGTGIPVIASEHTGVEHYQSRKTQRALLSVTPLLTKKITVVSEQIRQEFPPHLRRSMVVIPNPVSFKTDSRSNLCGTDKLPKTLLSVGSLSTPKDQKCLISAFAIISSFVPDWNLRIVGEGALRGELENQIKELQLESRIQLPGSVKNIANEYLNAQLFVLPSLYESFGLATAEAIAHGLPVVGFADCAGTNQLIRHNENGLLVSGERRSEALANALKHLMLNAEERCRLGGASTDWLVEKFGIDNVLDQWERLLLEVTSINDSRIDKCVD